MALDIYGNPISLRSIPSDLSIDSVEAQTVTVGSEPDQYQLPDGVDGAAVGSTFVYTGGPALDLQPLSHTQLTDKGTFTHPQIDAYISQHGGIGGDGVFTNLNVTANTTTNSLDVTTDARVLGETKSAGFVMRDTSLVPATLYSLPKSAPTFPGVGQPPYLLATSSTSPDITWALHDHNTLANRGTTSHANLDVLYGRVDQDLLKTSEVEFKTVHTSGGVTPGTNVSADTVDSNQSKTHQMDWKKTDGNADFTSEAKEEDGVTQLITRANAGADLYYTIKRGVTQSEIAMVADNVNLAASGVRLANQTGNLAMTIDKGTSGSKATMTFGINGAGNKWEVGTFGDAQQALIFEHHGPSVDTEMLKMVGEVTGDAAASYKLSSATQKVELNSAQTVHLGNSTGDVAMTLAKGTAGSKSTIKFNTTGVNHYQWEQGTFGESDQAMVFAYNGPTNTEPVMLRLVGEVKDDYNASYKITSEAREIELKASEMEIGATESPWDLGGNLSLSQLEIGGKSLLRFKRKAVSDPLWEIGVDNTGSANDDLIITPQNTDEPTMELDRDQNFFRIRTNTFTMHSANPAGADFYGGVGPSGVNRSAQWSVGSLLLQDHNLGSEVSPAYRAGFSYDAIHGIFMDKTTSFVTITDKINNAGATGDLFVGTGTTMGALPIGLATKVLTSNGTTAAWSYPLKTMEFGGDLSSLPRYLRANGNANSAVTNIVTDGAQYPLTAITSLQRVEWAVSDVTTDAVFNVECHSGSLGSFTINSLRGAVDVNLAVPADAHPWIACKYTSGTTPNLVILSISYI